MNTTIAPVHRRPKRFVRRLPWITGSVLLAGLIGGGVAVAYWQSSDASNPAGALADSLPQGATPTASLTDATTVAVDFARATTTGGREVTSYTIRRYDAATSTSPSATFTCSWPSGSSLSCSESAVPGGTWYYTDTPSIAGSEWTGAESAKSSAVTSDVTVPTVVVTSITPTPNGHGYNNSSPVTVNLSATDGTGSGVASISYSVDSGAPVTVYTSTAAVPVSGDGTHTVSYSATDNAGNSSATQSQTVKIDSTAPAMSGLAVPTWINSATKVAVAVNGSITEANTSTITVVATDHNGATVTKTVAVASGATTWNTTLDLTTLDDGTIGYSATAQDDADNPSTPPLTATSIKDTAVPSTPTTTNPGANLHGTVTLQSTNVSDNPGGSGVREVTYEVKASTGNTWSTACAATTSPWSCGFDTTAVADGNYDFRAVTIDNAGNSTTGASVTGKKVDNIAPTVSNSVNPPSPNANGWYSGSVTVTLTASDAGSGVDKVYYTTDGSTATTSSAVYAGAITLTAERNNPVRYLAVDVAGNQTTGATDTIRIDKTAPTATSSVSPTTPNGNNGWYTVAVTVTITPSDTGSGVDKIYYTTNGTAPTTSSTVYTGAISLTTDGSNPVRYLAVDLAGNETTGSTALIKIDRTAPTAAITCPTGTSVKASDWQACVTGGGFKGTVSESGSGIASVEVQIKRDDGQYWNGTGWGTAAIWLSPTGTTNWSYGLASSNLAKNSNYTLSVRATDNAGNVPTTPTSYTFKFNG